MQIKRRDVLVGGAAAGLGLASGPALARQARGQRFYVDITERDLLAKADSELKVAMTPTFVDVVNSASSPLFSVIFSAGQTGELVTTLKRSELSPFASLTASKGYTLRSLSRYGPQRLYVGLFEQGASPRPTRFVAAVTAAEYQTAIDGFTHDHYEPAWVSVDNLDGQPRFTLVGVPQRGAWQARHHVRQDKVLPLINEMKAKGLRTSQFAPYQHNGATHYAMLFRPAGTLGWQAWFGRDSLAEDHQRFSHSGHHILQATGYIDGGVTRYAGVWQTPPTSGADLFYGN